MKGYFIANVDLQNAVLYGRYNIRRIEKSHSIVFYLRLYSIGLFQRTNLISLEPFEIKIRGLIYPHQVSKLYRLVLLVPTLRNKILFRKSIHT